MLRWKGLTPVVLKEMVESIHQLFPVCTPFPKSLGKWHVGLLAQTVLNSTLAL